MSGIYNVIKDRQLSTWNSLNLPHSFLNQDINGISHGMMIGVCGQNKSGKSRFVDNTFIVGLILENPDANIKIDKYSLEVNLFENICNYISILVYHYHNEEIDTNVILGNKKDKDKNKILLTTHQQRLIQMVLPKLEEIVGVYDDNLNLIKQGIVRFICIPTNPTGVYKECKIQCKSYGKIIYQSYTTIENGKEITKQKPLKFENPDNVYYLCIIDDLRLLSKEDGNDKKKNIDKMVEYMNELRLFYGIVFIPIQHIGRAISDIKRITELKEFLAPTEDDLIDSGDLAQRCTHLIAIFDPSKPQYGLTKHFGVDLNVYNSQHPNYKKCSYRSVHLLLNRNGSSENYSFDFKGNVSHFKEI